MDCKHFAKPDVQVHVISLHMQQEFYQHHKHISLFTEHRRRVVAIFLLFTRLWICVGRENGGQLSMLQHLSLSSRTTPLLLYPPLLFSPLSLQRNSGVDWLTYHLKLIIPLSRPLRHRFNQK